MTVWQISLCVGAWWLTSLFTYFALRAALRWAVRTVVRMFTGWY